MKKAILILLILSTARIWGQDDLPKVKAEVNYLEVLIGDQVSLTLTSESKKSQLAIFPKLLDTLGKLEIITQSQLDTNYLEDRILLKKELKLSYFDTGKVTLPAIQVIFENEGTELGNFISKKSNQIDLYFKGLEIDSTKGIRDIKTVRDAPWSIMEIIDYIYWFFAVLILIGLSYGIYRKFFWKEKLEEKEVIYDPKIPADILAIESLNSLKQKELWQNNKHKEYFTELTEILRIYIFRVYNVHTLEQTSNELLSSLDKMVNENLFVSLKNILETADLVKFAKYKSQDNENILVMEQSFQFIEDTRHLITDPNSKDDRDV